MYKGQYQLISQIMKQKIYLVAGGRGQGGREVVE